MPAEYYVDYRWFLERQADLLDDLAVNDYSVFAGLAARHKIDPPRHDQHNPSSDPCQRARDIADDARSAGGPIDSGIGREQSIEPAGEWLDAARECLDRGGDPGPGL
ncbi:hypothetical protein [Streptomyces sp. NBC_00887]|uniref:hypothetical protein n=1 Tax=Streptomyces sp. NBC_00887 TaxID=2975859 RepID=UPI002F90B814|nr:hypothetical protein OG844_46265 [Streptomyces sp. NBC_00887]